MSVNRVCLKIRLFGLVQGIGFRWFVQKIAREENITGYVKNLNDGSVEIVAEAQSKQYIENFIQRVKTEHDYAVIRDVEIVELPPQNFTSFKINF
ncbi:MAG: acylphosphatase [Endomicrobia bacterium]|nr:acylphosphatase [Endomicrobiia bacterium]